MTNNGKSMDLVRITLSGGKMRVQFAPVNMALISHALRLASLELDNAIISGQQKNENIEVAPSSFLDKLRKGR